MRNLLDISDLNVSFSAYGRRQHILKDVALSVPEGGRVALIGETGCGKSLTGRAILGTLPDTARIESGRISLRGESVLDMPPKRREALKGTAFSIIMQDPLSSFNPVLQIGRHLDDVMRFADRRLGICASCAERKARIFDVLRKVQLSDPEWIFAAYPAQLSGGMRQRALIALSLLHQPELLIADEPGTALDVTTQDEIMTLIDRRVSDNGLSLLMITHNLGLVRRMVDEIYVMRHGEIIEYGRTTGLFRRPQAAYTRQLVEAIPPLYGAAVVNRPASTAKPMIELTAVSKAFARRSAFAKSSRHVAVKEVSLSIREGEIFGLAGESGSGKTTLARMIMGLAHASSGAIMIAGKPVDAGSAAARRNRIQLVYQNPGTSLNPKRTVGQTLAVPLAFVGVRGAAAASRIETLLCDVDLPSHYASKFPHELSGGQKQRVAIARALAAEPRIIVLDEPTSALDVSVQRNVIRLLTRLGDTLGLTFLFISHDLSLMRNFCGRIAIMLKGRIVETGSPRIVFARPRHPYTRALIAAAPVMSEEEENLKPHIGPEERRRYLVGARARS